MTVAYHRVLMNLIAMTSKFRAAFIADLFDLTPGLRNGLEVYGITNDFDHLGRQNRSSTLHDHRAADDSTNTDLRGDFINIMAEHGISSLNAMKVYGNSNKFPP